MSGTGESCSQPNQQPDAQEHNRKDQYAGDSETRFALISRSVRETAMDLRLSATKHSKALDLSYKGKHLTVSL